MVASRSLARNPSKCAALSCSVVTGLEDQQVDTPLRRVRHHHLVYLMGGVKGELLVILVSWRENLDNDCGTVEIDASGSGSPR